MEVQDIHLERGNDVDDSLYLPHRTEGPCCVQHESPPPEGGLVLDAAAGNG